MGLLLVNDHVLKAAYPGWLTGKLSDFAWMVVCPVLIAALLSHLRLPARIARPTALLIAIGSFIALQLYPPLGEAWIGVLGGAHVPDPADLIALPAAALAPLCWRPTPPRVWATPLAFLACMATSYPADERQPCDGESSWDPNRPLVLDWSHGGHGIPIDTPAFTEAISLIDASGGDVPLAAVEGGSGLVLLCPLGGLEPDADYTWSIEPFEDKSTNQATVPGFGQQGRWTFHTAETADTAQWPLIATEDDCTITPGTSYFDRFACQLNDTGEN